MTFRFITKIRLYQNRNYEVSRNVVKMPFNFFSTIQMIKVFVKSLEISSKVTSFEI